MRAGRTIGAALVVLIAAALATLWQAPPAVAAGQQGAGQGQGVGQGQASGSQTQQAEKQTADNPKVEKQTITVHKSTAGEPVVVTVEKQAGAEPKVTTHRLVGEPMIATALAGGPRIGVRIRDVGKEDVAKFKLAGASGVAVEEVEKDSAAEKAGVKAGDVIVQFDSENVRSAAQLTRLVRESVAGRTVKMGILRDGKRTDLEVTPSASTDTFDLAVPAPDVANLRRHLETVPEGGQVYRFERRVPTPGAGSFNWEQRTPAPVPLPVPEGDVMQWFGRGGTGNFAFAFGRGRLGVRVQELTPELAAYFGVKDGLLVNSVDADAPAAKAGIKAGDVVGSVNGKAVATTDELIKELADKDGEVTIGVTRDKKPLSLRATLEPRKTPARRTTAVGRPA